MISTIHRYTPQQIIARAGHYGINVTLDSSKNNIIVVSSEDIDYTVLFNALDVIKEYKDNIIEYLRKQG